MDNYGLKEFIYPTTVLLTYLDELDINELFNACKLANLSVEEVLKSKCGTMSNTISYLLKFSNPSEIFSNETSYQKKFSSPHFNTNKAYSVEIQGTTNNGIFTNTGHCFILINDGVNWVMMDSYIGEREFSYEIVNLQSINDKIFTLKQKFNNDLWLELTSCNNEDTLTTKANILMFEYDYSFTNIKEKFLQLLEKAKTRLNNEDIGIDDSYLFLLSSCLDIEDANNYLNSLYHIVSSTNHNLLFK